MPKNSNLAGIQSGIRDPRVVMRVIIGLLLVANLAAAVVAFKPFGGSAEDLRRDRDSLAAQLDAMQARIQASKSKVEKVQKARTEGDEFLGKYFMDVRTASSTILLELHEMAGQAGVKMGTEQFDYQPVEGSDTFVKQTITAGFDGTYANFMKFINLVDRSPRFLIIESMQAAAPQAQNGQSIAVTLKIVAFLRDMPGGML